MASAVPQVADREQLRQFMKKLIHDVHALEHMIDEGMIETGKRRIGVEQELFLVDHSLRPANLAMPMLAELNDPAYVTELGAFNLEFNSDTYVFEGDALSRLEAEMNARLAKARLAAQKFGGEIIMSGILPTLEKTDLTLENMAPVPRYRTMNDAMTSLRGEPYEFRITGTDELIMEHDSVMIEACNTSFQAHFQVGSEEFAEMYNVAQVVTAPLLAAACNSPLLFGKRLWRETRIALFQQSIDTRKLSTNTRDLAPRVSFGTRWMKKSVMEIFREDITRFRVILGSDYDEDPFESIRAGTAPSLKALRFHNGTIYRWNRPCYGITDGKPHLRIENRVLPAGPSILDEMANAALFCGLMSSVSREWQDVTEAISFDDAKSNFIHAARMGLEAQFRWLDGKFYPAQKLILDVLLPLAEEGLRVKGIAEADIKRYLGVIDKRVSSGQSGAVWQLKSFAATSGKTKRSEQMSAIAGAMLRNQRAGIPVHEWELAEVKDAGDWRANYTRVEQYMSTDLVTVNEEELVDLVACLMEWNRVRHVLVEDAEHKLVGVVSHHSLLRLVARGSRAGDVEAMPVREVMSRSPFTIPPDTTTLRAIELMREHRVSCLPIVKDGTLVGIVTERDFMPIASVLLEEKLKELGANAPSKKSE